MGGTHHDVSEGAEREPRGGERYGEDWCDPAGQRLYPWEDALP